jgi:hypothetical protein
MYQLLVYHAGDKRPSADVRVARAADVLSRIPELLAEHHGCEHIVVTFNEIRLFAVDCAGNRLP